MFLRKTHVKALQIKKSLLVKVPIFVCTHKGFFVATPLKKAVSHPVIFMKMNTSISASNYYQISNIFFNMLQIIAFFRKTRINDSPRIFQDSSASHVLNITFGSTLKANI